MRHTALWVALSLDLSFAELEVDLRSELLAFHARHYSANVMRLAVLGRQTFEALQDLVLSASSSRRTSPLPSNGALGRCREPGPVSAQGLRNPCPNTASGSARASTSIDHTARCDATPTSPPALYFLLPSLCNASGPPLSSALKSSGLASVPSP